MSRCKCHPSDLYGSLVRCPRCRHWSLDRQGTWEACERRRCGYESVADEQPTIWPAERQPWMTDRDWAEFLEWDQAVADLYGVRIDPDAAADPEAVPA